MSWFDAAGFANIAKSALKEAQKTIDRALDIKDEPNVVPLNTPVDPGLDDFFGTWGLTHSGNVTHPVKNSPSESIKEEKVNASMWGSFTGSFFDNPKEVEKHEKLSSTSSLEDTVDGNVEHFSQSKLVVQHSEEDLSPPLENENKIYEAPFTEINLDNSENSHNSNNSLMTVKNKSSNRLSVLSTESEKNSSESVEIISSSTECTSPDLLSLSTSSSSFGLKPASDSVEVLGESLTSPSSVEVIGSNSTNSMSPSQHTDEFASPLESPWSEDKSSSIEKISPDSVGIVQEDQDENSIAEDTISYTSVSESTSATVLDSTFNPLMKHQKMLKDTFIRAEPVTENPNYDIVSISDNRFSFSEAITRAPSRNAMHLALSTVSPQILIDTQPQSSKEDMTKILQKTNVIDIPTDINVSSSMESQSHLDVSIDEGSQSDKTLIGSDNIMESSSDTSTTETSSTSTHLKSLLADAMTEKSCSSLEQHNSTKSLHQLESNKSSLLESISLSQIELVPRESSPISSESRSDMVKIGSDQTSGHTSGDELETTTSSDIEIISSPNGDSSSTQSRQSPAKVVLIKGKREELADSYLSKINVKKLKGHTRELSEASSISDDSHSSEIDRLLKRISDMTEILESRECKLIDMNRRNAELQEKNNDLKLQLDSVIFKQSESADVSQVTEEYTQRLSALEKKFQQAIREKDSLRKQLDQVKQEAATRMSKGELESLINEKDEVIKELREEGEKLSKQQLQHSNIIKKLRAKEKENEVTIKHLRESIENLSSESDRLKKSLTAKDEVERTQIEAVHQLTTKNKKLESEVDKLKEQLDDLTQKYETVKKSLDAAKKELIEKNKATSELLMREQMLENLENQKKIADSQNEEIINQLENLRQKLRDAEEEVVKTAQRFREENSVLMKRLEEAEARNEELSQSVLEISKPLVRQLESLQATYNLKTVTFEKIEEELTAKIRELQTKVTTLSSSERQAKEECISLRSKLASMEGEQSSLIHKLEMLLLQSEQQKNERILAEQELISQMDNLNAIIKQSKDIITEQEKQINNLQQELYTERSSSEMEKSRIETSQSTTKEKQYLQEVDSSPRTASNSPTLSLGKASVSESMAGSFWSQDDGFDVAAAPRFTNMFEIQTLQTNLKQREGEVQQLQWQLNQREQERSLLNSEISSLLTRLEDLETKTKEYDPLANKLSDLERQYEALCQLYGEKVEENDELKLDLLDVKDMYKSQIDDLLKQLRQTPK